MSSGQRSLAEFVSSSTDRFRETFGDVREALISRIESLGISMDWLESGVGDLSGEEIDDLHRFQYAMVFEFPMNASRGSGWESVLGSVQFKTIIYTVGEPPAALKRRFRQTDNQRLRTMFNSGPYDGYMDGFHFVDAYSDEETAQVSAREVRNSGVGLGKIRWEVEAYDDSGTLLGHANGEANPYSVEEDIEVVTEGEPLPGGEVWRTTGFSEARNQYQIAPEPDSPARERAKAIAGKDVYLNGFRIGQVLGDRGRIRLKKEHKNRAQAKYASRQQIIEASGTPYQAIALNTKYYKVGETADKLILSTARPRNFEAIDPGAIDPEGVGQRTTERIRRYLTLSEDDPTQFRVFEDVQDIRLLGLYSPDTVRDITKRTRRFRG